jgi:hypothetical protein
MIITDSCIRPGGPATQPNSDSLAAFFDWVIVKRKADLLDNFSLGPTQMHMLWSAVKKGVPRCGWPNTWEEIWAVWTADGIAKLMNSITYLDPACGAPVYPGTPVGDPHSKSVNWLSKHTGNKASAELYWSGANVNDKSVAYSNALFMTNKMADSIGY